MKKIIYEVCFFRGQNKKKKKRGAVFMVDFKINTGGIVYCNCIIICVNIDWLIDLKKIDMEHTHKEPNVWKETTDYNNSSL